LVNPHLPSKIFQGITTEITGEGSSIAPLNDAIVKADHVTWEHYGVQPTWRTFRDYFARLGRQGMGIKLASYVGATQVRRMVLGDDDRAPSPAELESMKVLVRDAMREGAVGLSTSLQYAPAPYAKTDELIALAGEAAKFGGIYASHIRDESDAIIPALDEAFRIGREANIPVEIWHLKAAGKSNWGRMPEIVAHIEAARRAGLDVAADTYGYTAAFNTFSAVIPPWAHDGGDRKMIERLKDPAMRASIRKDMETPSSQWNNEWQQVKGPESFVVSAVQNPKLIPLQGKSIAEIARLWNKDAVDTVFDILIEDEAFTMVGMFIMDEPDVALALRQPWVSICNDSQGSALVRDVSADSAQVRAGRETVDAGRCHPQVHVAAVRAHALRRSRRAQNGDVGRRGGVRPGDGARPGNVRPAQPTFRGNALRAGERRAGHRGRQDDECAAGEGPDAIARFENGQPALAVDGRYNRCFHVTDCCATCALALSLDRVCAPLLCDHDQLRGPAGFESSGQDAGGPHRLDRGRVRQHHVGIRRRLRHRAIRNRPAAGQVRHAGGVCDRCRGLERVGDDARGGDLGTDVRHCARVSGSRRIGELPGLHQDGGRVVPQAAACHRHGNLQFGR